MIILTLVVWPFLASMLYSQIFWGTPENIYADLIFNERPPGFLDIPIEITNDELINSGDESEIPKQLEIILQIDSPINAENIAAECTLFERHKNGFLREVVTQSLFEKESGKQKPLELNLISKIGDLQLQGGRNTFKIIFNVGHFEDDFEWDPFPFSTVIGSQKRAGSFLSGGGPYIVECELHYIERNDRFYHPYTSAPVLAVNSWPGTFGAYYLNNSRMRDLNGEPHYRKTVLYVTKPYSRADFFQEP